MRLIGQRRVAVEADRTDGDAVAQPHEVVLEGDLAARSGVPLSASTVTIVERRSSDIGSTANGTFQARRISSVTSVSVDPSARRAVR